MEEITEVKEPKRRGFTMPCSIYDIPSLEEWFAEQAEKGWVLHDWKDNERRPEFEKCEIRTQRYWVEPAAENAEPTPEVLEKHAMLGWELATQSPNRLYYVWRAVNAGAHKGTYRAMEDSHAETFLQKKMRSARIWSAVWLLTALGFAYFLYWDYQRSPYPAWLWVTQDLKGELGLLGVLLPLFIGIFADPRDDRARKRLLASLRTGEPMEKLRRARGIRLSQAIPWITMALSTMLLFGIGEKNFSVFYNYPDYDEAKTPTVRAEIVGARADEPLVEIRRNLTGDKVTIVREGYYRHEAKNRWWQAETTLEVYEPRFAFLSDRLMQDICALYIGDINCCEVIPLGGIDEAFYHRVGEHGVQFLLLRSGSVVLYYSTNGTLDLREHLNEFARVLHFYETN